MELTCPKCHGSMRSYERNGVHVDQCTDCRGIFLDRGELERLMDAENSWHAGAPAAQRQRPSPQPHNQPQNQQPAAGQASLGALVGEVLQQARAQQSGHGQHQGPQRYQSRKKKSSFLGELFG